MMPVPLSYFSPVVGGLPGASALGMEPTYYWDALDADACRWLREHTPPGRTVVFATNPTSWLYLRQTGELPHRLFPFDPDPRSPDPPAWYVLQNRPGAFPDVDRGARGPRPPRLRRRQAGCAAGLDLSRRGISAAVASSRPVDALESVSRIGRADETSPTRERVDG